LRACTDARQALDDDAERVGGVVLALRLLLFRLEADEIAAEPRPVDEVNAHRFIPQEPAGLRKADDFHRV
jgi:hypothetical protein